MGFWKRIIEEDHNPIMSNSLNHFSDSHEQKFVSSYFDATSERQLEDKYQYERSQIEMRCSLIETYQRELVIKANEFDGNIKKRYYSAYSEILDKLAQSMHVEPIRILVTKKGESFEYLMRDEINARFNIANKELVGLLDDISLSFHVFDNKLANYSDQVYNMAKEKSLIYIKQSIEETNSLLEVYIKKYIKTRKEIIKGFKEQYTAMSSLRNEMDTKLSKNEASTITGLVEESNRIKADISRLEEELAKRIEESMAYVAKAEDVLVSLEEKTTQLIL